ncbi:MAG: methylmalonyl Co-A mutase-associated GTPase MeaB [Pseudomonadota bacterium]
MSLPSPAPPPDPGARLDAVAAGGKAALARLLAEIEARAGDPATAALLDAALARTRAPVIGLTGPPGVGKSTLTDALMRKARARGLTVGVVAVDPSSRRTGGALLGDRTRMARDPADPGVFVRSMAARDRLGGIAEQTFPAVVVMGALMDRVIVETVGVGQSETEIAGIADTVVVCAQPGAGDTLQAMKAGLMEIPDIVAVTKADLGETARRTRADLVSALGHLPRAGGREAVEVIAVSAATGEGIEALVSRIESVTGGANHPQVAERDRSARRRDQAEAWLRVAVAAEFGRSGLAAFDAGRTGRSGAQPFSDGARFLLRHAERIAVR